jgi:hypothetical protein
MRDKLPTVYGGEPKLFITMDSGFESFDDPNMN